jgi:hypothetical protein
VEDATRAAETEAIFRDVNETIVEQQPADGAVTTLLCECSSDACAESVVVPRDDYERVRAFATRFFVRPRHVTPEIEVVVERLPAYWVIEKHGEAAEVAEETDPRS